MNSADVAMNDADLELARLISSVSEGCKPSFSRLYTLTNMRLFGLILQVNPRRSEAERVLESVFVDVWNRCAEYNPATCIPMNWLLSITHVKAVSSLHGDNPLTQKSVTVTQRELKTDRSSSRAGIPSVDLMFDSYLRTLGDRNGALDQLNEEQCQCLKLALYGRLSHQQIAAQMGCSIDSVKKWLRAGLLSLKSSGAGH